MKLLIIEDEAFAADALEKMILGIRPDSEIMEKLESVVESVEWLKLNRHPDLIFCDIHLSDGSSFEIFKHVEVRCPVIFTTAYNQYAIEAFQVNSVDYLLKPIKQEELARGIRKYEDLKQESLSNELGNLQKLLLESAPGKKLKKSRFMVKSGQTIKTISSTDVAYFLAEEGVVLLVTFDGKRYVINYTLDQLDEQLEDKTFFRANRQLIVNIRAVKEVHPYFKGRLHLMVEPRIKSDQIISSSKASSFKEWLDM